MAVSESSLQLIPIILCFLLLVYCYCSRKIWPGDKSSAPTNWAFVGMMPAALQNLDRVHDYVTEVLEQTGGTFVFKGPWFAKRDFVFTSDPANINHILIKNFPNYPKGPEFQKMFDIFQYGVVNADSELWVLHKKVILSIVSQSDFHRLLERTVWENVENRLLPVLNNFAEQGARFDLQEIFQRFTFDSSCKLFLDHDPGSLSVSLPYIPCERGFDVAMEALFYRNLWPERFWKLQKWLGLGMEKKLSKVLEAFDQFAYPCITSRQEKLSQSKSKVDKEFNCLTALVEAYKGKSDVFADSKRFLRDILLNLVFAGRDTTSTGLSWLFWLIATNSSVETKLIEEIVTVLNLKEGQSWRFFTIEESRKLVYLHGAVCEALRLFPPAALERKDAIQPDILPSGHRITSNTKILLSFYSVGRMKSVWGEDCLEFKPERWISERGRVIHQPRYKFPAFLAGQRSCLGKEMSLFQMKMVAATIIYNYKVELVEGHVVSPKNAIIIQIKQGLMIRLSRRN